MTAESWGRDVFDRLYRTDPDPWRFDTSAYEAAKYADTLAALGEQRFVRALELGCANGAMTARLAPYCDALVSVDISPEAIALARDRCRTLAQVGFHVAALPGEFARLPPGPFDLVVISELLYFLSPEDIERLAALVLPALAGEALVVLVNWTGDTDTPCTGEAAADRFLIACRSADGFDVARHRRDQYRLDRIRRHGTGRDSGCRVTGFARI